MDWHNYRKSTQTIRLIKSITHKYDLNSTYPIFKQLLMTQYFLFIFRYLQHSLTEKIINFVIRLI